MNIAEEAGFCAKLSLFDTIMCNCLLKSVSNESRDAPCPDCVAADVSWTGRHQPLSWDRSEPLCTPPTSPIKRQTSEVQVADATSNTQTAHAERQQGDLRNGDNSDNTQQRKCTYSSGSEKNNSKSEFLCYPLQLQSKRRISFTKKQVEVFESLFEKTIYPDGPQLQEVAEKTGVSKARLKTWFANKRSRLKKERSKIKLESKDFPTTSPCKCRCKIRLPPLKKHLASSTTDDSVCTFNTSKIYWDIDGHHLTSKRALVNSTCSCVRTRFEKEVYTVSPSSHASVVNTHCSTGTTAVPISNNLQWLNSSGMSPLNVSPLLVPSVVVSPLTCPNAVTNFSYSVNLPQPQVLSYHLSYQVLSPPTFSQPQYTAPNGLCQGFVTQKDETLPIGLSTNNPKTM